MTSPRYYDDWWKTAIKATFASALGWYACQYLALPAQQIHQDDRLNVVEQRLERLEQQHIVMMEQLDKLQRAHEKP